MTYGEVRIGGLSKNGRGRNKLKLKVTGGPWVKGLPKTLPLASPNDSVS